MSETKPLDILADEANFQDDTDPYSIISAKGRKLSEYFKPEGQMFYIWGGSSGKTPWRDVTIVTFQNPNDYSGAKMFKIQEPIVTAIVGHRVVELSRIKPTYQGEDVVKSLREYAAKKPN